MTKYNDWNFDTTIFIHLLGTFTNYNNIEQMIVKLYFDINLKNNLSINNIQ